MAAAVVPERSERRGASTWETLAVFATGAVLSFAIWFLSRPLVAGTPWVPLPGIVGHAVNLLVALVWYKLRVAPHCPAGERLLLRWPAGSIGPWMIRAVFLLPLFYVGSLNAGLPAHLRSPVGIALQLFALGVMAGFAEELVFRPALQLPLSMRFSGEIRLWRLRLTAANLVTAVLFGFIHLQRLVGSPNPGQEIGNSILSAVIALVYGSYYERTRSYVGTALLHSAADLASFAASWRLFT